MTDIDLVQWFFDLEKITERFNWPVNVLQMIEAKRALDRHVNGKSPAADVLRAYQTLAGSLGPTVMKAILESDDAFPEVNHSGKPTPPSPGKVTLYVDSLGKRVLAECVAEWGMPPTFVVE